eukprot:CAMPEP_0178932844 /NCGR_PEP_ID=MMETSP0786-20121207/22885_1 /TAXON_ID=186022 /ORGANISM="Thalassionema frauenfeldii, Strain CCMP 1798" /LENGTH=42 /DNA_ID= /DNA_START= /DNA_END= /DNA_ORIENTATION=
MTKQSIIWKMVTNSSDNDAPRNPTRELQIGVATTMIFATRIV